MQIHALHLHESLHLTVTLSEAKALHAWERARSHLVTLHSESLRCLLIGCSHAVFQIVEDAIKVDSVQLHGYFDARVLRVMNQWRSLLSIVKLTRLNSITLVNGDLLAVEHDQVLQLAYDVVSVLRLASHGIIGQADFHEVYELSKAINLLELCETVATAIECLQTLESLNMRKALQTVLLKFEA